MARRRPHKGMKMGLSIAPAQKNGAVHCLKHRLDSRASGLDTGPVSSTGQAFFAGMTVSGGRWDWIPAPYRVRGRLFAGMTMSGGRWDWIPAPYRVRGRLFAGMTVSGSYFHSNDGGILRGRYSVVWPVRVTPGASGRGGWSRRARPGGRDRASGPSRFSLILRPAGVSSAGSGFSSLRSSSREPS